VEGLRDGQRFEKVPEKFEGYLSKRKRWPMKGWHKVSECKEIAKLLPFENLTLHFVFVFQDFKVFL
jgi:hypothetical protein